MQAVCWLWPLDLGALIKNTKEREVKFSKVKMLNVATPWRSLTGEALWP